MHVVQAATRPPARHHVPVRGDHRAREHSGVEGATVRVQRLVHVGDGALRGLGAALVAALGIDDEVEPHTVAQAVPLEPGDAFLLCSDGWWGALDEAVILRSLSDADTPEEWLDGMQQRIEAQAAPRQDNFSAIAAWVGQRTQAKLAA